MSDGDDNETVSEPAATTPAASEDDPSESSAQPKNGKRRRIFIFAGTGALLLCIVGFGYWLYARQFESTDDAFIEGDIVQISPRVSAHVKKIYVSDNQLVHKGDLLVELSTEDLEVKLEQAKAELANANSQYQHAVASTDLTASTTHAAKLQARSNVSTTTGNIEQNRLAANSRRAQVTQAETAVRTATANLAQAQAQVAQPESDVRLAQLEYDRRLALFNKGDISQQSVDQALNQLQNARSRLDAAHRQVDSARSRVDESKAAVLTATENYRQSLAQVNVSRSQADESMGRLAQADTAPEQIAVSRSQIETAAAAQAAAEAAVHQAELDLSYAKIYAPEEGHVTKKAVEEGQLVQIGMPLMAISMSSNVWVIANFKETQLENMRVGQGVDIEVDAYPGQKFKGKVDSFQAGTGSRFSVLPPENASGNYVKVVQRLPVKIVFDQPPDDIHLLVPGMSVVPVVKVR